MASPATDVDDTSRLVLQRNDATSRYEAWLDEELVGVADYTVDGSVLAIHHTATEPAWRGRGVAGRLTRFALDDIRAGERRVRPLCPYTRSFLDEHPDYRDLLG